MNDAIHQDVHRSVHLRGERKLWEEQRLRIARRLILDTGKTPGWSDPTFVATETVAVAPPSELGKARSQVFSRVQ